jgi:hypothetical protein
LAVVLVCGAASATAGPITPADPAVPLTFDTAAGTSFSLVTQDAWSLLFDDRTFSSDEESALALLESPRGRRNGFRVTVGMAGGRSGVEMDDVRHAIAASHVWSPLGYFRSLPRIVDWSPIVLSEDESSGRLQQASAWPEDARRAPRRVAARLRYHAPAGLQTTTLLPTRPGSSSASGAGDDFNLDFATNGVPALGERAQSIPAPPATILTLLGLAAWYARRTRRR